MLTLEQVVQVGSVNRYFSGASPLTLRSVVRSAIGQIPLCLGGEVDCVDGEVHHHPSGTTWLTESA